MSDVADLLLRCGLVLVAFLVLPLAVGQPEHKTMAHMQSRVGPMYAGGFHGWAQLVADGVKFVQKEDVTPRAADRPVFALAPAVALVPYLVVLFVIPLGPSLVGADLDLGLFFALAVMSVGVLGSLMARLGERQQVLVARRSADRLAADELRAAHRARGGLGGDDRRFPLAGRHRAGVGVVVAVWQLPALCVFLVAGLAELQRPPFDMPIADAEIIFGPYTEYGGIRFAMFLLAEYAGIVVLAALTATLFLGGWRGPASDELGWLWALLKTFAVAFCVVWFRVA